MESHENKPPAVELKTPVAAESNVVKWPTSTCNKVFTTLEETGSCEFKCVT